MIALNGLNAAARRHSDISAVQSSHLRLTSRFGGVAIVFGFVVGTVLLPDDAQRLLITLLGCMLPVFVAGVLEDGGWLIAPQGRLLASVCSGVLTVIAIEATVSRTGISGLDFIFAYPAISVSFIVIAIAGICHAFNLIDGLHGLCGLTSITIATALALISTRLEQTAEVKVMLVLAASVAGFLAVNFPRGLLFLGDGGAYALGFLLACVAVRLMANSGEVSPWALVLVFFWPVADTAFAAFRRLSRGAATFRADRMHFHQVTMRAFEILVLGKRNRAISNPVATLIMLPLIAAPSAVGVVFWNQNGPAGMAIAACGLLFVLTYRTGVLFAQSRGSLFRKLERKRAARIRSSKVRARS